MQDGGGGAGRHNLSPGLHISSISGTSTQNGNERQPKRGCCQKRNIDDGEWRPWSELLPELLSLISKRLSVADYLSFGRVCPNWRSVFIASKRDYLKSKAPFIIIKPSCAQRSCSLLELSTGDRYKTVLPDFSSKSFVGLSSGCLTFEGFQSGFMLANPITGNKLEFPRAVRNQKRIHLSNSAFLAYTMPFPDFIFVALCSLSFNLQFRRSKDLEWTVYSYARVPWVIVDVVAFEGRVYCITDDSQIGVLSLTSTPTLHMVMKSPNRLGKTVEFVASDELLLVVKFIPRVKLEVYRIDLPRGKWMRVHNMGNYALFMGGRKCSRLSDTSRWGGRSNCVYHLEFEEDVCVVYSLDGQVIEEFPIDQARISGFPIQAYCWYFPPESYKLDYVWDDRYGPGPSGVL